MKITVRYNPDILMVNAPLYAVYATSVFNWERQACALLKLDGYTIEFEADHDLRVAWEIVGANEDDTRVIDAELTGVTDGEWFDYSRQREADYEYGAEEVR